MIPPLLKGEGVCTAENLTPSNKEGPAVRRDLLCLRG